MDQKQSLAGTVFDGLTSRALSSTVPDPEGAITAEGEKGWVKRSVIVACRDNPQFHLDNDVPRSPSSPPVPESRFVHAFNPYHELSSFPPADSMILEACDVHFQRLSSLDRTGQYVCFNLLHITVYVPNQSQTPCLKPSWDVNNVPEITAVVAVSHLTSPPSFPGPYAPSVLAERIPEYDNRDVCRTFNASIKYLSHLHLQEVQGNRKAGTSRQCNGARGIYSSKDEVHMSQGPPVSRSSSSSNQRNDDRYKTLPPLESSRTLPPIDANSRSSRATNAGDTPASAIATPAHSPEDQKQSRSLGMHNILNPAGKESPEGQTRRRRMEQNELPSPAPTAASRVPSTTSTTTSPSTVSLPSITPPSMHTYLPPVGQVSRAIMTPRSASNYPPSLVTKPMPATIDAKVSPFLRSNDPTNSSVPESSLSSAHTALLPSTLPFGSNLPPPRSPTGRRPSGGPSMTGTMDRRSSLAGSDSPSTTYSSYSTPPASQTMAPSTQPSSAFFGIPYSAGGGSSDHPSSTYPHHHPFGSSHPHPSNGPISSASSAHHHQPHPHHHHNTSSYQIMTLETESGPIQVPVDVQAASKVADEKRKRNATASHRFRQRRKEKERETSCNIAKLEQQIRELAEERDFYARERDFYRGVVVRNPSGGGQAGAGGGSSSSSSSSVVRERPTSPRHLRAAATAAAAASGHAMVPSSSQQSMDSSVGGGRESGGHWHPSEDDGGQGGRNTRRRTSSYVPAQEQLPPSHAHHAHSHAHSHSHHHLHQQQQQQQQRGYPQLQPANSSNNNRRSDVHQGQQIGAYPSSSTTSTNEQQWHPGAGPPPPPPPPPPSSSSQIVEKLNYLQSTFSPKAYSPVVRQNDVYIHHKKKLSPLFPHRPNVPFTQARGNDAIMLLLEKRWLIAYTLHLPAKIFRHL
ncbi:MAG: hypothetical protein L6R37_001877 [Teloschistes peruensis]|nr:MAG: hypothetical protein L6R37_001877 [Teloschistes peruensis]